MKLSDLKKKADYTDIDQEIEQSIESILQNSLKGWDGELSSLQEAFKTAVDTAITVFIDDLYKKFRPERLFGDFMGDFNVIYELAKDESVYLGIENYVKSQPGWEEEYEENKYLFADPDELELSPENHRRLILEVFTNMMKETRMREQVEGQMGVISYTLKDFKKS